MLGQLAAEAGADCVELDDEPDDEDWEFDVEALVPLLELVAAWAATAPPPMTAMLNAAPATSLRTFCIWITSSLRRG
jgi:hypothetical protein